MCFLSIRSDLTVRCNAFADTGEVFFAAMHISLLMGLTQLDLKSLCSLCCTVFLKQKCVIKKQI